MEIVIPEYVKNKHLLNRHTRAELAELLNVSNRTLYNYMKALNLKTAGRGLVSIEHQVIIFNHYGWPIKYF